MGVLVREDQYMGGGHCAGSSPRGSVYGEGGIVGVLVREDQYMGGGHCAVSNPREPVHGEGDIVLFQSMNRKN